MKELLARAVKRALGSPKLTREEFAYQVLPAFLLDIIDRYLRVRVSGARFIPEKGPYIIVANHSGYMGFDALMIAHQIAKMKKRVPKIIAHKLWFLSPEISVHAHKLHLVPATYENGLHIINTGDPLILFPEGEEGNFKPTRYRYRLRQFRRGFVRLALQTGVPIIPAVVIGAEETHITLSQIRWAKELFGIIIPVPLNVIPLPAKWKIKFLKPIQLKQDPQAAADIRKVSRLSHHIRLDLQREINAQLKRRKKIFL